MAFMRGATAPTAIQRLAIPASCLLISLLGYGSQWLFATSPDLAPGPLSTRRIYVFNTLIACIWISYYRTCSLDPGRYVFPKDQKKAGGAEDEDDGDDDEGRPSASPGARQQRQSKGRRWCKKCAAPKPPRAHHCKYCGRCIPKMDHHCPWTANCVSMVTFPHFLRFLAYSNVSLWTLDWFVFERFQGLWASRHLPAYLGPTLNELILVTVLGLVSAVTSLALGILLATTVKGWLFNTTMIEGWEIERHEAAVERNEYGEGWWRQGESAPGGDAPHLDLDPIEFPYELGIFSNMAQAMGTANPLLWLWPFASGPTISKDGKGSGWEWEENGFNDREGMWPPADPQKARHAKMWRDRQREADLDGGREWMSPEDEKEAFRRRQEMDLKRWGEPRRQIMELEEWEEADYDFVQESTTLPPGGSPPRGDGARWTNAEGDQLADYGVDEDSDYEEEIEGQPQEEDEVPLAELIRRRKVLNKDGEDT